MYPEYYAKHHQICLILQNRGKPFIDITQKSHPDLLIGLVDRVFSNGPGNLSSIPGRVVPKTLKLVLDTTLLNTQQYKIRIKGKVEQSREKSIALLFSSV